MKQGTVNLDKMIFCVGDVKYKLVKIPTFNYSYKEKECLGGGWYGSGKETIHAVQENAFLCVDENNNPGGFVVATKNGRAFLQGKNSNKFIKKYIAKYITNQA